MAVAALESLGILFGFAATLQETMPMLGTELHGRCFRFSSIIIRCWFCSY